MDKCNKCDCDDRGSDIKTISLAIIIAAFTWIIAVSWNKFLEAAYDRYYTGPRTSTGPRFIYAAVITIAAVVVIFLANLWYINDHECDNLRCNSCKKKNCNGDSCKKN